MFGWALGGTVALGAGDFLGYRATGRTTVPRLLAISEPVAAVLLLAGLLATGGRLSANTVSWSIAAGVTGGVGQLFLYPALGRGPVSVVAPVSGVTSAAVPVAFAVLVLGRSTTGMEWLGFVAAGVAVAVLSVTGDRRGARIDPATVVAAVAAGAAFGLCNVCFGQTPVSSGLWPGVLAHATVSLAVLPVALQRLAPDPILAAGGRHRFRPAPAESDKYLGLAVGLGALEALAVTCIMFATRADLAVAGAVIALYPAVTVLLNRLVYADPIRPSRIVGLALAAGSVTLLAYG